MVRRVNSLIFFFVAASVFAEGPGEIAVDQFHVPKTILIEGKNLVLNGTAYRKASIMRVKVWFSELYLESPNRDGEAVLQSFTLKVIDLYALYDISAADSAKGWKASLDGNCAPNCEKMSAEVEAFLKAVPEFKKGDHYRYVFSPHGPAVFLNEKKIFSSTNPELGKLLLSTWIGKKPPSDEVKSGLLNPASGSK